MRTDGINQALLSVNRTPVGRARARHGLTPTGLYNVLEILRGAEVGRVAPRAPSDDRETPDASPHSGGPHGVTRPTSPATVTAKEKLIHDQGLVSVPKQLQDDPEAAVTEILRSLVTLGRARRRGRKFTS